MFDRLKNLLTGSAQSASEQPDEMLSAALLLTELARADDNIAEAEVVKIHKLLAARYELTDEEVNALLVNAQSHSETAVSLYEYIESLNARLDRSGKAALMSMLWQVAYADGHLDKHEDSLLRKVAGLLHLSDEEFIRSKLGATDQLARVSRKPQ